MKRWLAVLCAALSMSLATQAQAVPYNFNIGYNGSSVAFLEGGSNNPVGTNLQVGDTFLWNFHAAGAADYWDVVTGGGLFPFMAFPVNESGTRTGDFTLTLRLNGATVFTTSAVGSQQSFVHVGTNTITLATGLQFDEMILDYALTASTVANSTINSIFSWPGQPPEVRFPNNIAFVQNQIPEPSILALLGVGALAMVGLGRRRRQTEL